MQIKQIKEMKGEFVGACYHTFFQSGRLHEIAL